MTAFRVTFLDRDSREAGSRRWKTEAEARAFVAGLWRGKRFINLQLHELRQDAKPVKLPLKVASPQPVEQAQPAVQ